VAVNLRENYDQKTLISLPTGVFCFKSGIYNLGAFSRPIREIFYFIKTSALAESSAGFKNGRVGIVLAASVSAWG